MASKKDIDRAYQLGVQAGLDIAWQRVNEWIIYGPMPEPQRSERNGMVMACNLILQPQERKKAS